MKADGAQPIVFRQFFEKESCTYTYLLADADTREAILIDPVLETVDRDLRFVRELQLKLVYAVNTHCHADHVTGTGAIKRQVEGVKSGIASASKAQADVLLEPGDRIRFGAHELEVIATPGHTEGCICFYTLSGGGMVFTGDTLLVRGCGRTDFQGGSAEKLYDSVHKRLFTLPDTTRVFPAHDYKGCMDSTIGEEKVANPRLTKSKAEFVKLMGELGLDYPKQIDVALPANLICGVQD